MEINAVDTLASASGQLWKDCETFDKALQFSPSKMSRIFGFIFTTTTARFTEAALSKAAEKGTDHELEEQRRGRAQDERPKT